MSLNNEGLSCSLCHAYLFDEDDVVYCPVCGAPHHRECYNSLGHCALEELHGTEKQYDKMRRAAEEAKKAETQKPKENTQSFETPFGQYANIDFLGGVPSDYKLSENVTAEEAKFFVLANTIKYIPKFAKLSKKRKFSWNFMAFFFPCPWLLSRKMYKNGILVGLFTVLASILTIPLNNTLYNLGVLDAPSYTELFNRMLENMPKINDAVIIASFIGVVLNLIIRIICAVLGDYWYKEHTISTITKIKNESADIPHDFHKFGGVNLILFFIGLLAIQYVPALITIFI